MQACLFLCECFHLCTHFLALFLQLADFFFYSLFFGMNSGESLPFLLGDILFQSHRLLSGLGGDFLYFKPTFLGTRQCNFPLPLGEGLLSVVVPAYLFSGVWKLYPKHKDKAKALKEWNRLKADRKLMREMSAALRAQIASEEWQRDNGRAIPYPCRWLSHRRWEDELTERAPVPAPTAEELPWI